MHAPVSADRKEQLLISGQNNNKNLSVPGLPMDVIRIIFSYLGGKDVASFRKCCRHINKSANKEVIKAVMKSLHIPVQSESSQEEINDLINTHRKYLIRNIDIPLNYHPSDKEISDAMDVYSLLKLEGFVQIENKPPTIVILNKPLDEMTKKINEIKSKFLLYANKFHPHKNLLKEVFYWESLSKACHEQLNLKRYMMNKFFWEVAIHRIPENSSSVEPTIALGRDFTYRNKTGELELHRNPKGTIYNVKIENWHN